MQRTTGAASLSEGNAGFCSRNRTVARVTWVGLWLNLGLALLKIGAGIGAGSQAVLADGIHSLSDLVTDVVVLVGLRYWTAPPDERHPHGHGRIETLVTVFIGCALLAVALGLGYGALAGVRAEGLAAPGWVAFWAALLSLGAKEVLYRWTMVKARETGSAALKANAWHHRSDALSSLPAALAVAVAAVFPEWSFVDRVGAFVVCLFILQAGGKITWPALEQLIDRGATEEQIRRIEEVAMQTGGVQEVHAVRSRYLGQGLQVDLHVLVDPELTVREGHVIAEKVKVRLLELCGSVQDVVVHLEPYLPPEARDDSC